MIKIAIHGVNGQMGQAIAKMVVQDKDCELVAVSVRSGHDWYNRPLCEVLDIASNLRVRSNIEVLCQQSDVIIDFTRPDATLSLLPVCERYERAIVIGTTGFHNEALSWIEQAAHNIPLVFAPNTSLGVNILAEVSRQVAKVLGHWDVEIFEAHHKRKIDAPSGTALMLGDVIAKAQASSLADRMIYPHQQRRKEGAIGFASMRAGENCGEHTVYFVGENERLEFTHRAYNRELFAQGALVAAKWLVGKKAGLYRMSDVLGFDKA